jgi:dUTPase
VQIKTKEAVRYGIITDRNGQLLSPCHYEAKSSFDITIREVLIKGNKPEEIETHCGSAILKPQDSAYIISEELINVPEGYIAYVFLKNRMSQKGLLALNTGIIDQGYHGPISTLVINLSMKEAVIPESAESESKVFFRVVFHKIQENEKLPKPKFIKLKPQSYNKYKEYREDELKNLPRTFLDHEQAKRQITDEVEKKALSFSYVKLGATVSVVALLLSLMSFGRDFFIGKTFNINEYYQEKHAIETEAKNLKLNLEKLKHELKVLKGTASETNKNVLNEIESLRKEVNKSQSQ